jgi:hypothetical protein
VQPIHRELRVVFELREPGLVGGFLGGGELER